MYTLYTPAAILIMATPYTANNSYNIHFHLCCIVAL